MNVSFLKQTTRHMQLNGLFALFYWGWVGQNSNISFQLTFTLLQPIICRKSRMDSLLSNHWSYCHRDRGLTTMCHCSLRVPPYAGGLAGSLQSTQFSVPRGAKGVLCFQASMLVQTLHPRNHLSANEWMPEQMTGSSCRKHGGNALPTCHSTLSHFLPALWTLSLRNT